MRNYLHNMNSPAQDVQRRGFLLVVVMVVIILASLACYQFAERMTTERQIVSVYVSEAQALQAAESGIDFMLAMITDPNFDAASLATLPPEDYAWQTIIPADPELTQSNALMSVLVSREGTVRNTALTFGIASEGGKINLNGLVKLDVPEEQQREMLMFLPNMTDTLADTILDFIDSDNIPRDFGTESDSGDFVVRNGPLTSLDDLLAIPEITAQMLYGEDMNRNGLLDTAEDDGGVREPFDNADGVLDLGWDHYLTLWSRESNLRSDGTPKININSDDLDTLEQDLAAEFGSEVAQFIVAYRKNGPVSQNAEESGSGGSGGNNGGSGSGGSSMGGASGGGSSGRGSSGGGNSGNSGAGQSSSGNNSGNAGGGSSGGRRSGGSGSGERTSGNSRGSGGSGNSDGNGGGNGGDGGADGGGSAQIRIVSLYEFIDAVVEIDGQEVASPWVSSDLSFLQQMEDVLTIDEAETREGRIDLNYATYESLSGLPEISEALINEILNGVGTWTSVGDLLTKGIIDARTLQKLEPFLTTRSRTYRFTSVGLWQSGGPIIRIDAIIDTAGATPIVIRHDNLTPTGSGYSREELLPEGTVEAY